MTNALKKLCESLKINAHMITMGEQIPWGSETELMLKAADALEVFLDAMLSAKEQNHIYEAVADIEIALARAEEIAKGTDQ